MYSLSRAENRVPLALLRAVVVSLEAFLLFEEVTAVRTGPSCCYVEVPSAAVESCCHCCVLRVLLARYFRVLLLAAVLRDAWHISGCSKNLELLLVSVCFMERNYYWCSVGPAGRTGSYWRKRDDNHILYRHLDPISAFALHTLCSFYLFSYTLSSNIVILCFSLVNCRFYSL